MYMRYESSILYFKTIDLYTNNKPSKTYLYTNNKPKVYKNIYTNNIPSKTYIYTPITNLNYLKNIYINYKPYKLYLYTNNKLP